MMVAQGQGRGAMYTALLLLVDSRVDKSVADACHGPCCNRGLLSHPCCWLLAVRVH